MVPACVSLGGSSSPTQTLKSPSFWCTKVFFLAPFVQFISTLPLCYPHRAHLFLLSLDNLAELLLRNPNLPSSPTLHLPYPGKSLLWSLRDLSPELLLWCFKSCWGKATVLVIPPIVSSMASSPALRAQGGRVDL